MNVKSGWQLSEDGPNAYEKYVVPAFSKAWAQEIVNRACLLGGEKVLDVACGTGLVARVAAEKIKDGGIIHGIDINEAMIKKAKEIETGINWHHGDVMKLPFSDNSFDVILCQQGLQYFPNPTLALKEMNRVLVEKGRILLSVWRDIKYSPFYESLREILGKYVNGKAASMLSAAYSLGDAGKVEELFAGAGFRNRNMEIHIVSKHMSYAPFEEFVLGGMMATPFYENIQKVQESKQQEMLLEIHHLNRIHIHDNVLNAPMESYIVSVE